MNSGEVSRLFRARRLWLTEGAVVERLRRGGGLRLDPEVLHAAFPFGGAGRAALGQLYREYLAIAAARSLPLLLFTPTWRANPERSRRAGFPSARELNRAGVLFLREVMDGFPASSPPVLLGGLMGCRGDAYRAEEGLPREEAARYHREQADALADAGADFLFASTLPALPEALGMAEAMAATGRPWALSFLPRPDGRLPDGTPLEAAVAQAEGIGPEGPLYLAANCVYPTALGEALSAARRRGTDLTGRLAGLQANGSSRSPEELDGLDHLEAEPPEAFAAEMVRAAREWGLTVLGGCCGTDGLHIARLADGMTGLR